MDLTYKYQEYFPLPFANTVSDISSIDNGHRVTKVLDWKNYKLSKEFKNKLVDKLNGENVVFKGRFFIGSDEDEGKHIMEINAAKKADASNCYLYFVESDNKFPHKICLMRGWGHLTGTSACNLEDKIAAEIQDGTLNWICDKLNAYCDNEECVEYAEADPKDPINGIEVQYDEFFAKIDKERKEKENEEIVPYSITDDSKYDAVCSPRDANMTVDIDSSDAKWYSNSYAASFNDTPSMKQTQTPWYNRFLNKRHKKHK